MSLSNGHSSPEISFDTQRGIGRSGVDYPRLLWRVDPFPEVNESRPHYTHHCSEHKDHEQVAAPAMSMPNAKTHDFLFGANELTIASRDSSKT
jgi:hypothetical protein